MVSVQLVSQEIPVYSSFDSFSNDYIKQNDTTYIFNFWATWCMPCVKELPYFETLYDRFKKEKVKLILVSLDFKKQIDSHLIPFIKKKNLKPHVILLADSNYNGWLGKVDESWSGSIPATWLIKGSNRLFVEQEFEDADQLFYFVNNFISSHP